MQLWNLLQRRMQKQIKKTEKESIYGSTENK